MSIGIGIGSPVQPSESERPPFTGGRFSHKRGVGPPEIKVLRSSLGRFVPESDEIKVQDAVGQIDSHTDQHDAAKEVQNAQGLLSPLALEPAGGELSEGPGYDQHFIEHITAALTPYTGYKTAFFKLP